MEDRMKPQNSAAPTLIIVNGMPGAGKTTLSRKLRDDIGLPLISKDAIKELYFDQLGVGDREWSKALGRAAIDALFLLTDNVLATGKTFMIENAKPELGEIVRRHGARSLELYCFTDHAERHRRFVARNESGERHPGHIDEASYDASAEARDTSVYPPLEIGEVWKIDTSHFDETDYNKVRQKLVTYLKEGN
jgi:predicted kinase